MARPKKDNSNDEPVCNDDLSDIVNLIKKDFGKNSDVGLACDEPDDTEFVSTGSKVLDLCIHSEGLPIDGKITELLGLFSSGKSLILQMLIANAQKKYDAIGILVDRESAFTKKRGEQLGILTDKLIYIGPKDVPTITDAMQFICISIEKIREKFPTRKIIVGIDSIAAFDKAGKVKIKKDSDGNETETITESKTDMGRRAKDVHSALRKALNYLDRNTSFIILNQITYMPGIMYGNPQTSTSGEGSKYYSSTRIRLEQGKKIVDKNRGGEVVGQYIKCEIIKSRLDAAHRKCEIPFHYREGIPYYGGYLRLLAERGIIKTTTKTGENAYKEFLYKDVRFKEGQEKLVLEKFPELLYEKYPDWGSNEGSITTSDEDEITADD